MDSAQAKHDPTTGKTEATPESEAAPKADATAIPTDKKSETAAKVANLPSIKVIDMKAEAAAPPPAPPKEKRAARFALLAASVAIAAALGAGAGAFGAAGLGRSGAPADTTNIANTARVEAEALKATVAHLETSIKSLKDNLATLQASTKTYGDGVAALRANVTTANTATQGQFAKINEQLDRIVRTQAQQTQQLERRAALPTPVAAPPAPAPAQPETTGSVTPPARPESVEPKPTLKSAVLNGWVLRKVYDGAALIEGREGIIEIEPGSYIPGLGRVESIKRQDGRWVVVTSRGLIVPR